MKYGRAVPVAYSDSNTPDYDIKTLMMDLNEWCPGKERWYCTIYAIIVLAFVISLPFYSKININLLLNPSSSLNDRFFIIIIFIGLLIPIYITISEWHEWFKSHKDFENFRNKLNLAMTSIKLPNSPENNYMKEKLNAYTQGLILWLLQAILVLVLIYIFRSNFYIAILLSIYWSTCCLQVWRYKKSKTNASINSRTHLVLELLIAKGAPFGIYLRDFDRENDVVDAFMPIDDEMPPWEKVEKREHAILHKIIDIIPIFCFSNYDDMNQFPLAARINLDESSRKNYFIRYAENASLIIITLDKISIGLEFELEWIEEHNAWDKCFLLLDDTFGDRILLKMKRDYPKFISTIKWLIIQRFSRDEPFSSPNVKVPDDLITYLNKIAAIPVKLFS